MPQDDSKPLTLSQFATELMRGGFDKADWFAKAVETMFSPVPQIEDAANKLGNKIEGIDRPAIGAKGVQDYPEGLEGLPDIIKNLLNPDETAKALLGKPNTVTSTLKGGAAGMTEGLGSAFTPADALGMSIGQFSKEGMPLATLADKIGKLIEAVGNRKDLVKIAGAKQGPLDTNGEAPAQMSQDEQQKKNKDSVDQRIQDLIKKLTGK